MTLLEFIAWLLGSGGIGWLCSGLLSWFDEHWFAFAALRADLKRLASFGITAGLSCAIGVVVILLSAWMGYEAAPITAQLWVERLFAIASAAILAGQVRHASVNEQARRKAEMEARWRMVMGENDTN